MTDAENSRISLENSDGAVAAPQTESAAPPEAPVDAPLPPEPAAPAGMRAGAVVTLALTASLVAGTIAGFGAGLAGAWFVTHTGGGSSGPATVRVIPAETDEPAVAAALAAVPSVVNVEVTGGTPDEDESLPQGHPGVPRSGNGSGVAFRHADDGGTFILTNNHVVEDAELIVVTNSEGERSRGTVIGADPESDIAVVRVDPELPLIELGKSAELQVGQLVVAIGSPFGLSQSVSSGVVSAIGRSLTQSLSERPGVYPLVDVIQTDAAINPGNSGGALVDRDGRLVGINTAIFTETGVNDGIGFAIPIDNALRVADSLIESGDVEHPFLGIVGRGVDAAFAETEDLPVTEGAYVIEVAAGTEAEASGIRTGDLIVGLDDAAIRSMDDLILQVRRHLVGDSVTLSLYRDGELIEVEMKVGAKPKDFELPSEATTVPPLPEGHPGE